MTTYQRRQTYWPHVDGLRAIAVLSVVLYHINPQMLPGGFAGVDVFFVVSGFVVTMSSLSRGGSSAFTFFTDFLARRFRRILPALIVCLLVTSLASALWIPASWLSDSIPRTGRLAFFGLGNFALARGASDYFSPLAAFNPFTHTWSLAVEEQFYFLAPLLIWSWIRGGRWRWAAVAVLVLTGMASYVHAWRSTSSDSSSAYYVLSTRFWEIGSGVALAWTVSTRPDRGPQRACHETLQRWGSLFALMLLMTSFIASRPETFPGRGAWMPVAATMLLLGSFHCAAASLWTKRVLGFKPLVRLGQLSYSLYLWHWPVIVIFRWTIGLHDALTMGLAAVISLMMAWLSWRFVERPVSRSLDMYPVRRVLVYGVVAMIAGASVSQTLQKQQHLFSFSSVAKERSDWYPSRAQKLTTSDGCTVAPKRVDLARGWYQTFERNECPIAPSAPRIFAAGDSHALAYGPLFARYAMETGAAVTVYNMGGCPLLSLQANREAVGQCPEAIEAALADMLPRLRSSDVVFLPSLRLPRYVEQGWLAADPGAQMHVSASEAQAARNAVMPSALKLLQTLRRTGAQVVIQAPNLLLKPRLSAASTGGHPVIQYAPQG